MVRRLAVKRSRREHSRTNGSELFCIVYSIEYRHQYQVDVSSSVEESESRNKLACIKKQTTFSKVSTRTAKLKTAVEFSQSAFEKRS